MGRYHLRQLLREARVSRFEEHSFLTGLLLIVAAVVLAIVNGDFGGSARTLGALALAVMGLCATSRGLRLYRANVTAALPEWVGRASIRIRPGRISTVTTAMLALALPVAGAVAMVALVEWGWLAITGALLLGCLGLWYALWIVRASFPTPSHQDPSLPCSGGCACALTSPCRSSSWRRTPRRTPGRRGAAFT